MNIENIHIDGFGQFNQLSIDDLQPGLTIFKGNNEAGKSTLLSFIRCMLFDFPGARSASKFYPPLAGGNHGGRLVITTDSNERCVIERYAGNKNNVKVTFNNGVTGADAELSKLLNYIDKDIFNNIYAFGLDELQRFETLNNENIRANIYSAGIGTGRVSIPDVQKGLKNSVEVLYKKRGRNPEINQLVSEIEDMDRQISDIKNDQAKYDSLHADEQMRSNTINLLKDERSRIQKKLNRIHDLISVQDDWKNMQDARITLSDLPQIKDFPEKGIDNLDRILEKITDVEETISLSNEKSQVNKAQQERIIIDEELLVQRDTILDLGNGIEKYRSEKDQLPEQKQKLKNEYSTFLDLLGDLGPKWDEEMLNRFDRSIPAKETVIQKRKLIDEVKEHIEKIQTHLMQRNHDLKNIDDDINKIKEKIHSTTVTITYEEMSRKMEALRNLRQKYPILTQKESELKSIQKEEAFFSAVRPAITKTIQKAPFWPAVVMFLIGIMGLIYGYYSGTFLFGSIFFILLCISAVAYYVSTRQNTPISGANTNGTGISQEDPKETRDFSNLKQQLIDEISSLKDLMQNYANSCGFDIIPEPALLEKRDMELQETAYALKDLSGLQDECGKLSKKRDKLIQDSAELKETLNNKQQSLLRIDTQWKEWLLSYDLDPTLSPESILEIFSTIKSCYEKQKTIYTLKSQINSTESSIHTYEERIQTLLKQCGRIPCGLSLDMDLQKMREDVEDALNQTQQLNQLHTAHEDLVRDLSTAKKRCDNLNIELSDLLSSGHSDNEDMFRKNARVWEKRLELYNEIQSSTKHIRKVSGDGKLYDNLIDELEKADITDLKTDEEKYKDRLEELDNKLSINLDDRGAIHNKIEQLEHHEEGSKFRMEREIQKEQLHNRSRNWAALVIAQEILNKAIEIYEKERQPAVIIEAQSFFANFTARRYKRIYSPLDSADIFVEDRDGKVKGIDQLSKGTKEQLYLALRFGFIRYFGKQSEAIPIVFDEILVNFDPVRSQNASNAIRELAATNQILFFTCHPETVKILADASPDAQVIDLDNCLEY
ncbi:MAG: AAA family ATPase [Methanosarcinales archaeon]|nr:AAA family ATPase [Methanosarcinales archaeon]